MSTRRPFEKEWHRYVEDLSSVLQSAGAHPIGALLVFLHLLKCEAERCGELLLAHAEHHAPHAQPAADVLVDGIWCFHSALLRDDRMPNIASRALVDASRGCMFDSGDYRFERPGCGRKIRQSRECLPGIAHRCESRNSSRLECRGRTTPRRRGHGC